MGPGRGEQIKLINPSLGTEKVDVHLNRLVPGGPRGKVHHHTNADNVYIVKRDVADEFNNHWHVKSAFLKDIPATGVRVYNYYDDGLRNTVGGLDCTRYIVLSNPRTGEPVAIVDEHWSYAIRSTAAAAIACK